MKFNERYGILFKKEPPVEWTRFFGILTVNFEYLNSVDYSESYHKDKVKHVYNGNYRKLCKFMFGSSDWEEI